VCTVNEKTGARPVFFVRLRRAADRGSDVSRFVLALVGVFLLGTATAMEPADFVLRGGEIYTVDDARSWAQALAIRGNQIVFVGTDRGVAEHVGTGTQILDLNGEMVLPGFQDAHVHPVKSALNSYMCSLFGLPGIEAYLVKIEECVAEHRDAKWIHGAGWSHSYFAADNQPTKSMLDAIAPEVPLTLYSYDGHSLWANSKALEMAGVDEHTADVPSGRIIRFPGSREPTGLFLEDPAQDLVMSAKPKYSDVEVYGALLKVQRYFNSLGVTSIQDALLDIEGDGRYGILPAYRRAARNGELSLRVVGALYWNPGKGMEQVQRMLDIRTEFSTGLFRPGSVKVWQDGVMHTHTSRLLEDYADRPGERGMTMIPVERLNELVAALDKNDFQMHFHADGDGAVRQCLDAVEFAMRANGRRDSRHHIAHLELIHPDDIPRFRTLGVVANVQPMWSTSKAYISDLINVKIGPERKRWLEINKSFLDHGVTVAYGSDWSVTSSNPMDLIEAAVTRIRPALPLEIKRASKPILAGENVGVADAIASYTINGAYVNHQEEKTGSIEVGKLADIVVLDSNLFEVAPVQISETRVLLTFVDGNLVYGKLPLH
jgi:predicted amidohydrolase YtcJ